MRPDNCVACTTPLPTYRSNRMVRCSKCAKDRNRAKDTAYKTIKIEVKCPRCQMTEIRTRVKKLCNKCYHEVNYIPKPRKKKIQMKKCKYV